MHTTLEELRDLPLAEKLKLVEQLWNDISNVEVPAIVQEWHKTETRRRMDELELDPSTALTRKELWKQVDAIDE